MRAGTGQSVGGASANSDNTNGTNKSHTYFGTPKLVIVFSLHSSNSNQRNQVSEDGGHKCPPCCEIVKARITDQLGIGSQ